jgi:hypothetical protein
MPKIVEEDGFVISWEPRSKKGPNSTPASSPSLSTSSRDSLVFLVCATG